MKGVNRKIDSEFKRSNNFLLWQLIINSSVAEEMGLQIEVKDIAFVIEGLNRENFHRVD